MSSKSLSKRREIRFEILIRAKPHVVWRAITDPKRIAIWSYMNRVEVDCLEVGGRFLFYSSAKSKQPDVGIIKKIIPLKRLVYEWHSNEPEPTTVDYKLEAHGDFTRLIFINSGFGTGKQWSAFYFEDYGGWIQYHLKMARYVENLLEEKNRNEQ